MNATLSLSGAGVGTARAVGDYLAEVDVLRAVAVFAVVASHVSPSVAGGGYLGVDVFFVVSGFLIARSNLCGSEPFSTIKFLVGRLNRIVPPLLVFTLVLVPIANNILVVSDDHNAFFDSLYYQGSFTQNLYYADQSQNYFHGLAQAKPGLHLWSIAAEMQFYLVFGFAVSILARRGPLLPLASVTAVATVVSYILAIYSQGVEGYYLLEFRAWEFGLGVLVAILATKLPIYPLRHAVVRSAEAFMLLALVVPMLGAGGDMNWTAATLVCLGTVGLLYLAEMRSSVLLRAASRWVPLTTVGRASYSFYLWHWPLFSCFAYLYFDFGSRFEHVAMFVLMLIPLALASYVLLEVRLRRRLSASTTLFLLLAFFFGSAALSQVPFSPTSERHHLLQGFEDNAAFGDSCGEELCIAGAGPTTVVLWGDSHARALWLAMEEIARVQGVRLVGVFGCMPGRRDGVCEEQYQTIRALLLEPSTRNVLLAARWAMYADGFSASEPEEEGTRFFPHEGHYPASQAEMTVLWRAALSNAFQELGSDRLVVFEQVPAYPYFPPKEMLLRFFGLVGGPMPDKSLATHRQEQATVSAFFNESGVRTLDPTHILCPSGNCITAQGLVPLYHDDDHLSVAGARALQPLLAPLLDSARDPVQSSATEAVKNQGA